MASDTERTARTGATIVYTLALLVLFGVWLGIVGPAAMRATPALWVGPVFGVLFLAANALLSQYEVIGLGSGAQERADANTVTVQSFYVVAALFAYAQLLTTVHGAAATPPLSWFVGVMFFAVALILPPLWFSTDADAAESIAKHARSACMTIGISLLVGILAFSYAKAPDVSTMLPGPNVGGQNVAMVLGATVPTVRG